MLGPAGVAYRAVICGFPISVRSFQSVFFVRDSLLTNGDLAFASEGAEILFSSKR